MTTNTDKYALKIMCAGLAAGVLAIAGPPIKENVIDFFQKPARYVEGTVTEKPIWENRYMTGVAKYTIKTDKGELLQFSCEGSSSARVAEKLEKSDEVKIKISRLEQDKLNEFNACLDDIVVTFRIQK
jgi:hypothetical protein